MEKKHLISSVARRDTRPSRYKGAFAPLAPNLQYFEPDKMKFLNFSLKNVTVIQNLALHYWRFFSKKCQMLNQISGYGYATVLKDGEGQKDPNF